MQTLIYKTELFVERAPAWLTPNSIVELRPQADGTVAAFARRPAMLVRPVLETDIALRVRVVELHPAHLTADRRARISVSVWGSAERVNDFETVAFGI
mgnify:CR=1 FL=1